MNRADGMQPTGEQPVTIQQPCLGGNMASPSTNLVLSVLSLIGKKKVNKQKNPSFYTYFSGFIRRI